MGEPVTGFEMFFTFTVDRQGQVESRSGVRRASGGRGDLAAARFNIEVHPSGIEREVSARETRDPSSGVPFSSSSSINTGEFRAGTTNRSVDFDFW